MFLIMKIFLKRIKACASIEGSIERKAQALQVAASVFNSIESTGLKTDSITYTSMFHAVLNLTEDATEKVDALSGIFQRCCADGCLNQHMMTILASKVSREELLSIIGHEHAVDVENLPVEWSKHARTM